MNLNTNDIEFSPRENENYKIFDEWTELYDYLNTTNLLYLDEQQKKRRSTKKKKDHIFTKYIESEIDDPEHENFISGLL